MKMQIRVLGCGTSSGVPLIGCQCQVCQSRNPKNSRLRASIWIKTPKRSLLIDTSTDLRLQALKNKIFRVDAILYTHPHADHISGIDEVRAWNFLQNKRIPAYGSSWTCSELRSRYPYIFDKNIRPEGGGIPQIDLIEIKSDQTPFNPFPELNTQPLSAPHGSQTTLGYRIGTFAYLTDCSYIPPQTLQKMQGLEVLILDCVRLKSHPTHLNLNGALEVVRELKPKKTFLTHLGHDFDYNKINRKLPAHVQLAYDGQTIWLGR